VGDGAVASPEENARTQRYVTLEGQAPTSQGYVTFRYHQGTSSTSWTDIPTADVTVEGTTTNPSWPMGRNGSGAFDRLVWNLGQTVTAAGGSDGPEQIQACFRPTPADTPSCTAARTVQYTRSAFQDSHATAQVGPGTVALLTGDYSLQANDVTMPTYTGELAVGRTLTTLAPAAATADPSGIFGPGWTSNVAGPEAGVAAMTVTDNTASSGYVSLKSDEGAETIYSRTGTGGYPYSYVGLGDAATDGSKLVKDSATQISHYQIDGTRTIFMSKTVGSATIWVPDKVVQPGSATTSTFTTDSAGRVTRILGPVPAGVDCSGTLVAGCRALTLTYATSTTATGAGGDPATWGNYTGQISTISMSLNGGLPTTVAVYKYDTTAHLDRCRSCRHSVVGCH
jgi:hypothetical protein